MLNIKILGPGCANCAQLEKLVHQALEESSTQAEVIKVTDPCEFLDYDVMSPPGLVIDEKTVSSGRIPSLAEITQYLQQATS